jgi:ribonuclease/clavin/mitogillin
MRDSVAAVFTFNDQIYMAQRQAYLKAFPGYHAFPGGKIEKNEGKLCNSLIVDFDNEEEMIELKALCREIQEELNFSIEEAFSKKLINGIYKIATATTPSFNPLRFKNHFYKIELNQKIEFNLDKGEASWGGWKTTTDFVEMFNRNELLAVPPIITLLKELEINPNNQNIIEIDVTFDDDVEVPHIEILHKLHQVMPLSKTLYPATRTNAFVLGDEKVVLIDPAPRDARELEKFLYTIKYFNIREVFLTHHHIDHCDQANTIALELNVPISMSKDTQVLIKKKHSESYFEKLDVLIYSEGDVLTTSNGEEIILYETPGHDKGQLGLAPRSLNWFIVGDLIQGIGTVVIPEEEGDMEDYMNSLERVIKLSPRYILPSHGLALGGTSALTNALEHRRMRENQMIKLSKDGKNLEEMLESIYPELKDSLKPYAMMNIKSHLKKLKQS